MELREKIEQMCKDAAEVKAFMETKEIELTDADAEYVWKICHSEAEGELGEDDLEMVAGGAISATLLAAGAAFLALGGMASYAWKKFKKSHPKAAAALTGK